jgi:hypothetical protein
MSVIQRDFRGILRVVLSACAGLLVIAAMQQAARATEGHLIVVPSNDGYGVQECLSQNKGCGEIVAAAWCEAEGYSTPLAFGRAEDITGVVPGSKESKLDPDAFVVKCGD